MLDHMRRAACLTGLEMLPAGLQLSALQQKSALVRRIGFAQQTAQEATFWCAATQQPYEVHLCRSSHTHTSLTSTPTQPWPNGWSPCLCTATTGICPKGPVAASPTLPATAFAIIALIYKSLLSHLSWRSCLEAAPAGMNLP